MTTVAAQANPVVALMTKIIVTTTAAVNKIQHKEAATFVHGVPTLIFAITFSVISTGEANNR